MDQLTLTESMIDTEHVTDTEDIDTQETEKKKLIGCYDYTVLLTYTGMLAAFAGVIWVTSAQYTKALICLMIAGISDMFDGTVASTKKRCLPEKHFGVQIDSLSDLISFGVLPAVLVSNINGNRKTAVFVSGFYLLCALIRLAQYNVTTDEQLNRNEQSKAFSGLPVTSSALLFPLVYILLQALRKANRTMAFCPLMLLMGIAFLTPFKLKRPNTVCKLLMIVVGLAEFLFLLSKVA